MRSNRSKNGKAKPLPKQTRHGVNVMKKAVKVLGNRAIDGRTRYGRALNQWRQGVCDDLGGEDAISSAQRQLIDTASFTKLLLDTVDVYLVELGPGIINKRSKQAAPILIQRNQMADSLVRQLQAIGLERQARPMESLQAYIARKDAAR